MIIKTFKVSNSNTVSIENANYDYGERYWVHTPDRRLLAFGDFSSLEAKLGYAKAEATVTHLALSCQ